MGSCDQEMEGRGRRVPVKHAGEPGRASQPPAPSSARQSVGLLSPWHPHAPALAGTHTPARSPPHTPALPPAAAVPLPLLTGKQAAPPGIITRSGGPARLARAFRVSPSSAARQETKPRLNHRYLFQCSCVGVFDRRPSFLLKMFMLHAAVDLS